LHLRLHLQLADVSWVIGVRSTFPTSQNDEFDTKAHFFGALEIIIQQAAEGRDSASTVFLCCQGRVAVLASRVWPGPGVCRSFPCASSSSTSTPCRKRQWLAVAWARRSTSSSTTLARRSCRAFPPSSPTTCLDRSSSRSSSASELKRLGSLVIFGIISILFSSVGVVCGGRILGVLFAFVLDYFFSALSSLRSPSRDLTFHNFKD